MLSRLCRIGSSLLGGASLAAGVLGAALAAAPASANAVPADDCSCANVVKADLPKSCAGPGACQSDPCVWNGTQIYCDID